jgi:hypothetical protein
MAHQFQRVLTEDMGNGLGWRLSAKPCLGDLIPGEFFATLGDLRPPGAKTPIALPFTLPKLGDGVYE